MAPKTFYLVDASMYIYRGYHAIPNLTNAAGQPTGAVYAFAATINKLIKEENPRFLALIFDSRGPTFRHEIFPSYKANRPAMPEDLASQQALTRRLAQALGAAVLEKSGFEADDLIATLASRLAAAGDRVVIVGADKDLYQCLGENVSMYDPNPKREMRLDEAGLLEKTGLTPAQFIEAQGLMGDSSDNYKGVPGVGEKTAAKLIAQFGTLENLYAGLDQVKNPKLRQKLAAHREDAFLSRSLARLDTGVEIQASGEDLAYHGPDAPALAELYRELDFTRLLDSLELTPGQAPARQAISYENYRLIDTQEALQGLMGELKHATRLAVDLETTGLDPMRAGLVGISLAAEPGRAVYIPVGHEGLFGRQLDQEEVLGALAPLLTNPKLPKIGQNAKYDYIVLKRHGVEMEPIAEDTMLAAWLLDAQERRHNLDALAKRYLDHDTIRYKDVVGDKKKGFETVSPEAARDYAAEDADLALILAGELAPRLEKQGLTPVYRELELPLLPVLAAMEMAGVGVDRRALAEFSSQLAGEMSVIEDEIYRLAGGPFNINSPQQLGQVLFEKLGLAQQKKTKKKTGFSTDHEVLETLAAEHELPALVLGYRSKAKLRSTYTEALVSLINPETGRVHTSYNQAGTATGRLSSSEPNLQNIPIRTEEGRRIRAAFVAGPGQVLLAADYSQIELRVLAHFTRDAGLINAFRRGLDIHAQTAAEIFGVAEDEVTGEMRRNAKAINFGILYGKRAFGLARDLGIDREEAQAFLDRYFDRYASVLGFIEETIEKARTDGYVSTLMGRRRALPELKSRNHNVRANAERIAINTPIQGTAADIIKLAMINLHRRLEQGPLSARMLMQVHDELVFEVAGEEAGELKKIVAQEMEHAVELAAPLKVDAAIGQNWAQAH